MANPGNTAKNLNFRSLERASDSAPRRAMLTAMALSLFLSCSCPVPALALFSSKKSSMQLPVNDNIELETMDPEAEGEKPEESSSTGGDSDLLKPIDLSPLSLDSDKSKEKEQNKQLLDIVNAAREGVVTTKLEKEAKKKKLEQQIALQKDIGVRNTQQLFKLRED